MNISNLGSLIKTSVKLADFIDKPVDSPPIGTSANKSPDTAGDPSSDKLPQGLQGPERDLKVYQAQIGRAHV